jgi:Fe-S-cluster containining protein
MKDSWWTDKFGPEASSAFRARNIIGRFFPHRSCPEPCNRPCCTAGIVGGVVNLFEIMILAAFANEPATAFFNNSIELSTETVFRDGMFPMPQFWQFRWKLKRICRFLSEEVGCLAEKVQPFACRFFPDAFFAKMEQDGAGSDGVRLRLGTQGFRCALGESTLIDAKLLKLLSWTTAVESAISDLVFFKRSPYVIDITSHLAQITTLAAKMKDGDPLVDVLRQDMTLEHGQVPSATPVAAVRKFLAEKFEPKLREAVVNILGELENQDKLEQLMAGPVTSWMRYFATKGWKAQTIYSLAADLHLTETPLFP